MEHLSSRPGQRDQLGVLTTPNQTAHNPSTTNQNEDQVSLANAKAELLTASSCTRRAAAARELGRLGGPSASTYLIAALYDTSAEVCFSAVNALGSVGEPLAIGPLKSLLNRHRTPDFEAAVSNAISAITARCANAYNPGVPMLNGLSDEDQFREEEEKLRKAEKDLARRMAEAEAR